MLSTTKVGISENFKLTPSICVILNNLILDLWSPVGEADDVLLVGIAGAVSTEDPEGNRGAAFVRGKK